MSHPMPTPVSMSAKSSCRFAMSFRYCSVVMFACLSLSSSSASVVPIILSS